MPRSKRSFETRTDLRRRSSRVERASFLILVEGVTEKNYFTGMRTRHGPQVNVNHPIRDHLSVVKQAADLRSDEYDAVWCVLDTELDPELAEKLVQEAKRSGVQLALSTPCFEVWLILHHKAWRKPFQSADEAKKALSRLLPAWTEAGTTFTEFKDGVAEAGRRARDLDPSGEDHMKNPSTSVWKLVESLQ